MKINTLCLILAFMLSEAIEAQVLNQEIETNGNPPYLLGKINRAGLEGDNYKDWFSKNCSAYQPDSVLINTIAPLLKTYRMTLFMGTWCGDSKQEVPRLYKVLKDCDFPMQQLNVIALSREPDLYKQSPQHEEAGLNIHRVPTVILYKNGIEVNRIIEHPVVSFEADIKEIVTKNTYQPNYQIVAEVDGILAKKGIRGLKKKRKKLLKIYKGKVSSMYELNTYARILSGTKRTKEAIAVLRLNRYFYPEQLGTHTSLANALYRNGKLEEAIQVLEEAMTLHPTDTVLKKNLELLKSN